MTMTNGPLISVGMSVRNSATTLLPALRSLLSQTCTDWELILIDDGSIDATSDVARSIPDQRIRLVTERNSRGLAYRLNQAIDLARGRYFARMDGDDVCFPERFARQAEYLDRHSEIDLLGSGGVVFSGAGRALGLRPAPTSHDEICRNPWAGFYLAHPSWMGRIEWFRGHRYNEQAHKAQDYDLLLRTHRHSHFAALPDVLIGYREEQLDKRKNLASRQQTVAAQCRYAKATGQWAPLPAAMVGQMLKATIELVLIGTFLERRVLKHRARPMDADTANRWNKLWRELNPDVEPACVA